MPNQQSPNNIWVSDLVFAVSLSQSQTPGRIWGKDYKVEIVSLQQSIPLSRLHPLRCHVELHINTCLEYIITPTSQIKYKNSNDNNES